MPLTEPGFYQCEPVEYHADPAPEASLSAHVAMDLLDKSPLHVFWYHPRLGAHEKPASRQQDNGAVAHVILSGRGRQISIIKELSFRKNVARIERDAARTEGKIPCLEKDYEAAQEMVRSARASLATMADGQYAFNPKYGHSEIVVLNRDVAGVWTRGMIDFYGSRMPIGVQIWDYKTTSGSANPATLADHMSDWALQAAMYERIVSQLKPELAGRLSFRFLVQENTAPYVCSVVTPSSEAMTIGHKRVAAAIHIWKRCLATDKWPAYPNQAADVSLPAWFVNAWITREIGDEAIREMNDPYLAACWPYAIASPAMPEGAPIIPEAPIPPVAQPVAAQPVAVPMPDEVDGGAHRQPRRGRPKGKKWTEAQKEDARKRYHARMAELAARDEPPAVASVPKRIDL